MAVAVVTGGSGGIGSACVERLARDGFEVVSVDRVPPATPQPGRHVTADLLDVECDGRSHARRMLARRRARERRRRGRAGAVRRGRPRGLGARRRRQRAGAVLPAARARPTACRRGRGDRHRVDRGDHRARDVGCDVLGLRLDEGGAAVAHGDARGRARPARHPRQRGRAGSHPHADDRDARRPTSATRGSGRTRRSGAGASPRTSPTSSASWPRPPRAS